MTQFRGKFTNKLDKKARVSVPATFRAILGGEGLVLRRSVRSPCIEAWPVSTFNLRTPSIDPLQQMSEDEDNLEYAMCSDTVDVLPDAEGRVVLPEEMIAFAALSDSVTFLGRPGRFELWEPAAAEARIAAGRAQLVPKPAPETGA